MIKGISCVIYADNIQISAKKSPECRKWSASQYSRIQIKDIAVQFPALHNKHLKNSMFERSSSVHDGVHCLYLYHYVLYRYKYESSAYYCWSSAHNYWLGIVSDGHGHRRESHRNFHGWLRETCNPTQIQVCPAVCYSLLFHLCTHAGYSSLGLFFFLLHLSDMSIGNCHGKVMLLIAYCFVL